jgi:hypothetical protein
MLFATTDYGTGAMVFAFFFLVAVTLAALVTLFIAWGACLARNASWRDYLGGLVAALGSGLLTAVLWFVVTGVVHDLFRLNGPDLIDLILPGIGVLTGILMGCRFARRISSPEEGSPLVLTPSVLDEVGKRFNTPRERDGVAANCPSDRVRLPEEEVTVPATRIP